MKPLACHKPSLNNHKGSEEAHISDINFPKVPLQQVIGMRTVYCGFSFNNMQINVLPPFGVLHRYNICNMWFEEQVGETTQLLLIKHNSTFNF